MQSKIETKLERLLRRATHEAGMRPEFYRRLLDADVLVPIEPMPGQGQHGTIDAGSQLAVKMLMRKDGVGVIPFYSSARAVFEGSPLGEECVSMRVRELFEARPDMHFHLNPFSEFGRAFPPHEVASLLSSGLPNANMEEIRIDEDFSFVPPRNPPAQILDSLRVLFSRNEQVESAFTADVSSQGTSEPRSLLIAIEVSSDHERILREAAAVMHEHDPQQMTIDLTLIERNGSGRTSTYFFKDASPFYTRKASRN